MLDSYLEQRVLYVEIESSLELLEHQSEIDEILLNQRKLVLIISIKDSINVETRQENVQRQLYNWLMNMPVLTICIDMTNEITAHIELLMMCDIRFAKDIVEIDNKVICSDYVFDFYTRYGELMGQKEMIQCKGYIENDSGAIYKSQLLKQVQSMKEVKMYIEHLFSNKSDEQIMAIMQCMIKGRNYKEERKKEMLLEESMQFCKLIIKS